MSCGFFFLYNQVYVVLPLYLKTVVESKPAMDIYTMANPLVIVCFQLLVTRLFGRMRPIRSMIVGTVIIVFLHFLLARYAGISLIIQGVQMAKIFPTKLLALNSRVRSW